MRRSILKTRDLSRLPPPQPLTIDAKDPWTFPHDPSKNLGGWTVGHHHHCVHCRSLGKGALDGRTGHPYNAGHDSFRHECPVCLQFWFSAEWCGERVTGDPKFVQVPNPGASIVRGADRTPLWMLPPELRRL